MRTKTYILLFRILLLFEVLWGAQAWFTWEIKNSRVSLYVVYIIVFVVAEIYKNKLKIQMSANPYVFGAMFCFLGGVLFNNRFSPLSIFGVLLNIYPIWIALSDVKNVIGHLSFLSKGLAIIILPGLVLYLLNTIVNIPGFPILHRSSSDYVFINHIFFLERDKGNFTLDSIERFHSVFLEPGYLGTMLSFLFFALKFNFKNNYNKILLLALILSFSLAGYITTLFGYLVYVFSLKKSIKKLLYFCALLFIIFICALKYNDGDNIINNKIISRLSYDEEKVISGNNRATDLSYVYLVETIRTGEIWMGLGKDEILKINNGKPGSIGFNNKIAGGGVVVYILTYGLVSVILFILFYYFLSKSISNVPIVIRLGFLLIVILTFMQATYPQSPSWIYPFVLGLNNYKLKYKY